ncbi:MAG: formylmethanofuran dehydrogenase subunit C [Euryarchaeota archaeon]|nr:formylmethanofuran dehydrogenase subunit C [Euryarchaeota archaeon]
MAEITLTPKDQPATGMDAECICPDVFAGKGTEEIGNLEVYYGNRTGKLSDFFEISGEAGATAEETVIVIAGDVPGTKRIGQEMSAGEIVVKGSAGMYVGIRMSGGRITVEGDVDAFCGQRMLGGEIHIKGSAGNRLGSAYRGDWRGMRGGKIVVEGSCGSEPGTFMQGGTIWIKGDCGAFPGAHARKGLIVIEGECAGRPGAQAIGGNLVMMNPVELLPGFVREEEVEDPEIGGEKFQGSFTRYSGHHVDPRAKMSIYVKV